MTLRTPPGTPNAGSSGGETGGNRGGGEETVTPAAKNEQNTEDARANLTRLLECKAELTKYVLNTTNKIAKPQAEFILKMAEKMQLEVTDLLTKNEYLRGSLGGMERERGKPTYAAAASKSAAIVTPREGSKSRTSLPRKSKSTFQGQGIKRYKQPD